MRAELSTLPDGIAAQHGHLVELIRHSEQRTPPAPTGTARGHARRALARLRGALLVRGADHERGLYPARRAPSGARRVLAKVETLRRECDRRETELMGVWSSCSRPGSATTKSPRIATSPASSISRSERLSAPNASVAVMRTRRALVVVDICGGGRRPPGSAAPPGPARSVALRGAGTFMRASLPSPSTSGAETRQIGDRGEDYPHEIQCGSAPLERRSATRARARR